MREKKEGVKDIAHFNDDFKMAFYNNVSNRIEIISPTSVRLLFVYVFNG